MPPRILPATRGLGGGHGASPASKRDTQTGHSGAASGALEGMRVLCSVLVPMLCSLATGSTTAPIECGASGTWRRYAVPYGIPLACCPCFNPARPVPRSVLRLRHDSATASLRRHTRARRSGRRRRDVVASGLTQPASLSACLLATVPCTGHGHRQATTAIRVPSAAQHWQQHRGHWHWQICTRG